MYHLANLVLPARFWIKMNRIILRENEEGLGANGWFPGFLLS